MPRSKTDQVKKYNKFKLYEEAVQSADVDAKAIDRIFRKVRSRRANVLREDFCGSGWLCAEWARLRSSNRAVGLDLDEDVLAWGRERHLTPDVEAQVELHHCNVLNPTSDVVDVVTAFNYSYSIFRSRAELRGYFASALDRLGDDGVMIIDVYGGPDSQVEREEEREQSDCTYVWDQASYNPVNGRFKAHIHFRFEDGSEIPKAFSYDWRLWQMPELTDIFFDAGFSDVQAFFEKEDKHGEGTGRYRRRKKIDADLAWIGYLVALK